MQNISGTHQLYARILDAQSGWQRTIPLIPKTAFSSNSYSTIAIVDLCQVESLVVLMEEETDLRASTYTLEIITNVAMTANVAEQSINDSFESNLVFRFDKVHFYLAENPGQDPLRASKEGLASSTEANTLSLLGWKPTVLTLRALALIGSGTLPARVSACGLVCPWNRPRQPGGTHPPQIRWIADGCVREHAGVYCDEH